jgi:hypothetical protein
VIRRKLTLKRIDPWSVLKFGFVINLALLGVVMLGLFIVWLVINQLDLIDKACDSVGRLLLDLDDCGVNGGNLFRTLFLLGLLSVVAQTGIMVFGAFLYNLIADLTGGLGFTFLDESGDLQLTSAARAEALAARGAPTGSTASATTGSSSYGGSAPGGPSERAGGQGAGSRPGSDAPTVASSSVPSSPTPPRPANPTPDGPAHRREDKPMFPRRDDPTRGPGGT